MKDINQQASGFESLFKANFSLSRIFTFKFCIYMLYFVLGVRDSWA